MIQFRADTNEPSTRFKPVADPAMSEPLTAGLAYQVAAQNLKGPVIKPWVDYLTDVIMYYARQGRFVLETPWQDRLSTVGRAAPERPTSEMEEAIKNHFVSLGFKWNREGGSNGPYTEISWKS